MAVSTGIVLTGPNFEPVIEFEDTENYRTFTLNRTTTVIPGGLEISFVATNTSSTNNSLFATSIVIGLPVASSVYPKASTQFWVNDSKLRGLPSSAHTSTANRWGYQAMGYPGNVLNTAAISLIFNTNQVITVSTNYDRQCTVVGGFTTGSYHVEFNMNYALPQGANPSFAPNDWLLPGESRSFKVWVQTASDTEAISDDTVISTYSNYINWRKGAYNNHTLGTKIDGRLCGIYLSQLEAPTGYNNLPNLRKYWAFNPATNSTVSVSGYSAPNVHPETCTGWEELLDACFPVQTLLAKGYTGVVLWAITGYADNGEDLMSNQFDTLPTNLRNTMSEIQRWTQKTGLKVYIYCGYGGRYYQYPAVWNGPQRLIDSTYRYNPTFSIANASGSNIASGLAVLQSNFDDGIFNYVDGVFLDASPDMSVFPWFKTIANTWGPRNKVVGQESIKSDVGHSLSPFTYFDQSIYQGICPLLNAITPGYRPTVIMSNFTDFAGVRADFEARLQGIETSGAAAIILGVVASQLPNIPCYLPRAGSDLMLGLSL